MCIVKVVMIDKSLLNKYSVYHIEETSNEKFIIKQQVELSTERGLDFFPFSNCIKISGSYLNISNNNFCCNYVLLFFQRFY